MAGFMIAGSGRISLLGDSSCVDDVSTGRAYSGDADCYWLVEAMVSFASSADGGTSPFQISLPEERVAMMHLADGAWAEEEGADAASPSGDYTERAMAHFGVGEQSVVFGTLA